MLAGGVVPTFDERRNGHRRFRLTVELAAIEKLAFQGGEEADSSLRRMRLDGSADAGLSSDCVWALTFWEGSL